MEKNVRENIYMCVYIYITGSFCCIAEIYNIVNQYSFLKRSIWLEGQKAVPYIGWDLVIWAQRHPPYSASNPSPSGTVRPRVFHRDIGAAQLIWLTLMYQASTWSGWAWVDWIRLATSPVSLSTPRCGRFDSVLGPGWEGGARWSMEIWSLVPLPFPNPAWTSGSSWFVYCWSDTVFPWCKWCVLMLAASCSVVLMLRFWGTLNYKSLDKLGDRICNPRVKIMSVTRVKQWEF